jgi:hypothetical protein
VNPVLPGVPETGLAPNAAGSGGRIFARRHLNRAFGTNAPIQRKSVIQRVPDDEDPAHKYWKDKGKGPWNLGRAIREGGRGVQGYMMSHFKQPSHVPSPEVRLDPTRHDWHQQLVSAITNKKIPPYLGEQWMSQNNAQAKGGNPLPKHAGQVMLEGGERMSQAKTTPDLVKGYLHAQYASLGGKGFQGGASHVMHRVAPFVQLPGMAMRSWLQGPQAVTHSNFHPLRSFARNPRIMAATGVATGVAGVATHLYNKKFGGGARKEQE